MYNMEKCVMDYEDFLVEMYTPLKSIENLSDIIYYKANNDWDFFDRNTKRECFDELISLNYLIGLSTKELLKNRKIQIDNITY